MFKQIRFPSVAVALIGFFCGLSAEACAGANSPWRVHQSLGRFSIRSQVDVPANLLADVRALEADIAQTLQLKMGEGAIEISLFRNQRELSQHLAVRLPVAANHPAYFVQGTDAGRVYLHAHRGWEKDLRHETTHAILHSALPYVPLWLDEGLAQFFEATPKQRAQFQPYGASVRTRLAFAWQPQLQDLEAKRKMEDLNEADYRAAWAWVFFLLQESQESRGFLRAYLQEIATNRAPAPLSQWLAPRMPRAPQRWLTFMKAAK